MTGRTKKMISELDRQAQKPFTKMCQLLDEALGEEGYYVFEGRRSQAVQEAYYAQGRETLVSVNEKRVKAGLYLLRNDKQNYKITWTMNSKHLIGVAMDILPLTADGNPTWDLAHYRQQFETIRNCGREAGLECGADWEADKQDWPHYELKGE